MTTQYDVNGVPTGSEWTAYYFGGAYEVRSDNTTIKYYSFAGQMVAMQDGTGLQYFLTDHLGSVVAVTNASGTLISQQRYLPFGGERTNLGSSISQTDYGYTGQRDLDPGMGGLMDYKARFYSPYLNRFIQPDTLIPDPSNPQAWNRFAYVHGNPMRFTDPSGHACVEGTSYCVNSSTGQTSGSLTSYNNSSNTSASPSGEEEMEEEGLDLPVFITPSDIVITANSPTLPVFSDYISTEFQEYCSAYTGNQPICNLQAWKSFYGFLDRINLSYDPSKVDGLGLLVDFGGIIIDIATVATLGTPPSAGLAGAGTWLDLAATGYQLGEIMGGNSGFEGPAVNSTLSAAENYGPEYFGISTKPAAAIPVIGSIAHGVSIYVNLLSGLNITVSPGSPTPLIKR